MKFFINLSFVLITFFTVPVNASDGEHRDDRVASDRPRNRMIEILPAESTHTHHKNIMGEIGEGTTFISHVPNLTFVYDSVITFLPTLKLVLESANEGREFSIRYPFLRMLSSFVNARFHPTLSALIFVAQGTCSEKNKKYFDAVVSLTRYAEEYLPNARDTAARNPLLVSFELQDVLGKSIGELSLGVFVSGASCKLLLNNLDATPVSVDKECGKLTTTKFFENTNSPILKHLGSQLQERVKLQLKQHEVKPYGATTVESYNIAPLFEFNRSQLIVALHPVAMCDLSNENEKFKQLTQIHFGQEYRDSTCLAVDSRASVSRTAFECRCEHSCFDKNLLAAPTKFEDRGAFHSGKSECFSDSEQAFLTFLENPEKRFISHSWTGDLRTGISHVTIRLLSPRDICKFCRGTLSMSMSAERNWLQSKLKDFLTKELNLSLTTNFSVRIFGYSTSSINSERR